MTTKNCCEGLCVETKCNLLNNCTNIPTESNTVASGVVSDIPVLLATHVIEFYLGSLIKLPDKVNSIDSIENKIVITDCRLLEGANVLFIKGLVRKNIYYSSSNNSKNAKICGNSKHCLACVPFECTTNVELNGSTTLADVNYVSSSIKPSKKNSELIFTNGDDSLKWTTLSHLNKISEEFFNKKSFCELVKSVIAEQCKYIYKKTYFTPSEAFAISEIIELDDNMSVRLEIQILQNQEVYIKPCCLGTGGPLLCSNKCNLIPEGNIEGKSNVDNNTIYTDKNNSSDKSSHDNNTSSTLTPREFLSIAVSILILNSIDPDSIYEIFEDHSQ
ncbi:hypothetical protein R9X47_16035 [Wukongibacter baidiensis]|uniref:hypothetical protein n=1 Tax=Wukongibacter baidiensis TaxID=1723361 RepID=UPI003D7FE8E2